MNTLESTVPDSSAHVPLVNAAILRHPVALQRCDQFVGRTMNWLYDHLRYVPRYRIAVFADSLENRREFPLLEAWQTDHWSLPRRLWRRVVGDHLAPQDWWRVRRLAPRLLHSHFGYVAAADLRLQKLLDVPWVVSFYGADLYQLCSDAQWRERYRVVFDRATTVLALGPSMAEHLQQLGCPADKVVVHPLGVDVATLPKKERLLRHGDPLKVLCAGTFREKKGLQYAIEAVALARRAGVPVKLALVGDEAGKPGDRETKERLFAELRRHDLEDITSHSTFMTFRDLIEVALDSHVFVAPSVVARDGDAEGTPFILQQMMATGMPAITTTHSDIPYLFGGDRDLLSPERDAHAIAERLLHYANKPADLVTDGFTLGERIRRHFSAHEHARRLAGLYDSITGG